MRYSQNAYVVLLSASREPCTEALEGRAACMHHVVAHRRPHTAFSQTPAHQATVEWTRPCAWWRRLMGMPPMERLRASRWARGAHEVDPYLDHSADSTLQTPAHIADCAACYAVSASQLSTEPARYIYVSACRRLVTLLAVAVAYRPVATRTRCERSWSRWARWDPSGWVFYSCLAVVPYAPRRGLQPACGHCLASHALCPALLSHRPRASAHACPSALALI